ncbi:MAG TPA: acyl carrier protein [Pseudonocardiaceae bacterium]
MTAVPSPTSVGRWLTGKVASYLKVDPAEIDPSRPLAEYGLDSVYALTLCAEIEDDLGLVVEPTLAWDYPTVTALAGHLHGKLSDDEQAAS